MKKVHENCNKFVSAWFVKSILKW